MTHSKLQSRSAWISANVLDPLAFQMMLCLMCFAIAGWAQGRSNNCWACRLWETMQEGGFRQEVSKSRWQVQILRYKLLHRRLGDNPLWQGNCYAQQVMQKILSQQGSIYGADGEPTEFLGIEHKPPSIQFCMKVFETCRSPACTSSRCTYQAILIPVFCLQQSECASQLFSKVCKAELWCVF